VVVLLQDLIQKGRRFLDHAVAFVPWDRVDSAQRALYPRGRRSMSGGGRRGHETGKIILE
jgi:hypothetical protein